MMGTKVEWRREERIYTRSCLFCVHLYSSYLSTADLPGC